MKMDPQETVEELAILAYIFKKEECTALKLTEHFKLAEKELKKKLETIRKLEIIRYSKLKIKNFDSLIIQSTDKLEFFFKEFYNQVISKEIKGHENENHYYILDEKREYTKEKFKKEKDFTIRATPKLSELISTIDYIVKSTENELRERRYL